jgi:hypothetical protein
MAMNTVWKRRSIIFGLWGILLTLFACSGAFGLRFIELFPVLMIIPAGVFSFLYLNDPIPEVDEATQILIDSVTELEVIKEEQLGVIKEYEEIFDAQLVELPCICGGNTFKGLFTPNTDNEVQCEKCKCNYRVNINYDTVLISEPLDQKSVDKTLGDV